MALLAFVDTHVKFGTFVLPNVLTRPSLPYTGRARTAPTPGRVGLYSEGAVRDAQRVSVNGRIVLSTGQSMDDAWRELITGLPFGVTDKLYLRKDDTTFRWAELESLDPGDSQEGSALDYQASFLCADPYEYSTGESAATIVPPATTATLNNTGGLITPVQVEVIVSAVAANPLITITNSTTGQAIKLRPSGAATYTIDTRLRTITKTTAGDPRTELDATTVLWLLATGNNTINITVANATLGNTTLRWRSRWP